jgi:maltose alpha-D-glucosyltransferase/alpha-amylase
MNKIWYKNAIFYELYLRAFKDSNNDGHGDFLGAVTKLDYLKDLGIDCIWLQPFYPSPLKDDGYDIADHYNIHPDYGTLDDFRQFVEEAHQRGLRVISDMVLNHTSDQHPWFQAARANRDSTYRDYYVWSNTKDKYTEARIIFLDTEDSNWSWDPVAGQYYWHRFYASQPDLNYDNPAVQQEMLKIMRFWLDLGLDGFRMDAVPYLFEREGTNSENLQETHNYLAWLRGKIDESHPGSVLLAEANQWPQDLLPYLKNGDVNMAFHFPLMPRIFMALKKADITSVVDILKDTPPIPDDCQWCTFLRNHDELTLEMVTEEDRQWMWEQYAPDKRMRLNLGIRRRLAPLLDNNKKKIALANSILFTLPGTPVIYYGDEIGMGDNIWLKDRDGVRTPMQWSAEQNGGFSKAKEDQLYAAPIDNETYGYASVNVNAALSHPDSIWHKIQTMISIRKQHPIFAEQEYSILEWIPTSFFAIVRENQQESILALHNLSDQTQTVELMTGQLPGSQAVDLITQKMYEFSDKTSSLSLSPSEYLWLHFNT